MVMLQHKLNVKLSQRQILTPGLVQMVSVLALNKIELKDMINAEMVENPVLEELEDSVPLIDEVGRREEERDRAASATTAEEAPLPTEEKKDPFDEIDFGSFFQDYLDPGYRSPGEMEDIERPSFENFLSKPSTLTDHLMWQLGALSLSSGVREAAELIIGNLNEDGYLIASDDELMGVTAPATPEEDAAAQQSLRKAAEALGIGAGADAEEASAAGAVFLRPPRWRRPRSPLSPPLQPPRPPRSRGISRASPARSCRKRWRWSAKWTLRAWPAATCASACSISCATFRRSTRRKPTATATRRSLPTRWRLSTTICAPYR